MSDRSNRRKFMKVGAAAMTAASASRVKGANDRVNMALIGCGGRGMSVARKIHALDNAGYMAFADVYDPQAAKSKAEFGGGATYRDFRKLLENKDVDAIHIGTPDHWHCIPAILGLEAGKHVYCEKPLTHNIMEGRAVVEASKKHPKQVFLTGTQHRSAPHFMEVEDMVQSGKLRDVHFVKIWNYANLTPNGIGTQPDQSPPEGLDWDMYLGPAPEVPFNKARFLRTYRWFFDYAGGWITDYGVHRFDTVHQIMHDELPRSVSVEASRFVLGGMGDQPDTLQMTIRYDNFVLSYEAINTNGFGAFGRLTPGLTHHSARGKENRPNGMAFFGSNGTVIADRRAWELIPEEGSRYGDRYGGTAQAGEKLERRAENAGEPSGLHGAHFIRCVLEGEKPRTDALTGHRASLIAHLGNIAYKTGQKLHWDATGERFIDSPEADQWLGRKARKPWDLVTA